MEWYLEWSPFQASLEKAKSRGFEIAALDDKVEPFDDLQNVWQAFFELSASRKAGYSSIDPLAIAEVLAWLDIHGVIELGERRHYYELLMVLDMTYIRYHRDIEPPNDS